MRYPCCSIPQLDMDSRAAGEQFIGATLPDGLASESRLRSTLTDIHAIIATAPFIFHDISAHTPIKVYECNFWMMLHGGGSAKRTVAYSNMLEIQGFDLGTLTQEEKKKRTTIKTVRTLNALKFETLISTANYIKSCLCSLVSQPAKASIKTPKARRDFMEPLRFHPRSCPVMQEVLRVGALYKVIP